MHGVSSSTLRRRLRLRRLVQQVMRLDQQPVTILALLKKQFAPPTALAYARTIAGMYRNFQASRKFRDGMRQLQLDAGTWRQRKGTRAAIPISPSDMRRIWFSRAVPHRSRARALLLFLSASRWGDIKNATSTTWSAEVLEMHLNAFKSDLFNTQDVRKFLAATPSQISAMALSIGDKSLDYTTFLRDIRLVNEGSQCSQFSPRGSYGAIPPVRANTDCAAHGTCSIQRGGGGRQCYATLRRTPRHKIPQLQQKMSLFLGTLLAPKSAGSSD